jgi:hypothetical protein
VVGEDDDDDDDDDEGMMIDGTVREGEGVETKVGVEVAAIGVSVFVE